MVSRWGNSGNSDGLYFLYSLFLPNHGRWWLQPWIKRLLLLGRKPMTNLDSILKSRDVTLQAKVRLVKAMVFPVVMYGCDSWTIKKAECQKIDAFELWCWRRLLRVPWTARRSNQSILKEINPEYSLRDWCWSWSSNTLVIWYEELTHLKRPWCWERLGEGGEEGNRGWDGWMASLTQRIWVWASSGRWWRTIWCAAVHGVSKCWTQLSNWTITTCGVVGLHSTGLQGLCLLNLKTEERTWSQ